MKWSKIVLISLSCIVFNACQPDDDANDLDDNDATDIVDINDIPNNGNDNNTNQSIVELGRLLFWDPVLSGGKDVACATCHHPDFGYADGRELALGIEAEGLGPQRRLLPGSNESFGFRNSPTILNTAFNGMDENGQVNPDQAPMFWDSRTRSLESQALQPLLSFEEMRGHAFGEDVALDSIVNRLASNGEYVALFNAVFNGENAISSANIASAIAAFERSLVATNSPFDDFQEGDQNAMTPDQIQGMNRFMEIGCGDCHSGPMFSDFELHVLGVPDNNAIPESDRGANGTYAFRTPTLRNLDQTGPYFHNGVGRNLQETIRFYITARGNGGNNGNGGGNLNLNPNVNRGDLAPEVRNLNNFNNNDIEDIIQFIEALNDPVFDREIPNNVPSGLNPGGNIN